MGYNRPGVRDGTGPARGSYQRKRSKIGRRRQRGEICPVRKRKKKTVHYRTN